MNVEQKIDSLKQRIAAAQSTQARAQLQKDQAEADLREALKRLTSEFGVSSIEEAKALAARLDQELNTAVTEVEQALEDIDAKLSS